MLFKYVALKNIRSYVEDKAWLPKGSVLLSGDIGAGKSTILKAMEFAIFGLKGAGLSGSSLLRHGKAKGEIELCFEISGKEVKIRRALKLSKVSSKTSATQDVGSIEIDGLVQDLTPDELTAKALEILGYPNAKTSNLLFRYTVYTPQEDMKRIITEPANQRLEIIRQLFGVEKYRQATLNSEIIARALRSDARALAVEVSMLQTMQKKSEELKTIAALYESEVQQAQNKLAEALQLQRRAQQELELSKKAHEQHHELEKQISNIRATTAELAQQAGLRNKEMQNALLQAEEAQKKSEASGAIGGINAIGIINTISATSTGTSAMNASTGALDANDANVLEQKTLGQKMQEIKKIQEVRGQIRELIYALERELAGLQSRKNALQQSKSFFQNNLSELAQARSESERAGSRIEELKNQINRIGQIETKSQGITGIADTIDTIAALEKSLLNFSSEYGRIAGLKKTAAQFIAEMQSHDDCPLCRQHISSEYKKKLVESEQAKLAGFEAELGKLNELRAENEKKLALLKSELSELQEKSAKQKSISAELNLHEEQLKKLNERIARIGAPDLELHNVEDELKKLTKLNGDSAGLQLESKIKDLKHELNKLEQKQELITFAHQMREKANEAEAAVKEIKNKIAELNVAISNLEKQAADFGDAKEKFDSAMTALKSASDTVLEAKSNEARASAKLKATQQELETNEHQISILAGRKKRMEFCTNTANWLGKFFTPLAESIEKHVLANVKAQFEAVFAEWFAELMDDDAMAVRLDDSFSPVIIQNEYETTSENLSGGEMTALALSYRLALNKVLNSLTEGIMTKDILILDEPTDGFSSEQLDRVRQLFRKTGASQLIVVSHEPKIESFVDSIIRVNKDNSVSRVLA